MTTANWDSHRTIFTQQFGAPPTVGVRAPGRVNLIGDHTDYHEGFVLPMAINRAILLQGRPRDDRQIRIYSTTLGRGITLDLDASERHPDPWGHYFQGVIQVLGQQHPLAHGADVLIEGDLPPGGGLSSSSALVVGFGALLARLQGLTLSPRELAVLGRDAEHWYGTTGGIMDQFVISHAVADRAVLLDCRQLSHENVPLPSEVSVVIANSGTRHNQIASPFARRRQQAEAGLQLLQARLPGVKTLRDVTSETLESQHDALLAEDPSGTLWRRCKHVVTEDQRVLGAGVALTEGDLSRMGHLMAASHASLRDDYEVSCEELDLLVATALETAGCYGARMTGGGFGGCTVNLVANEAVAAFTERVARHYREATGIEPAIFTTRPAAGVQVTEFA